MIYIVAFSAKGCSTAANISRTLEEKEFRLFSKTSGDSRCEKIDVPISEWTGAAFQEAEGIVFVGAAGIAVRAIAPHLKSKMTDPAVVCVDELGRYCIPLLSGHIGGANILAHSIASAIGAEPVITTATDINGKFSVDSFAVSLGMNIENMTLAKDVSAAVLDGRSVGLKSDYPIHGDIPHCLTPSEGGDIGIYITSSFEKEPYMRTLRLFPKNHILGIGCRKGTRREDIEKLVLSVLDSADVSINSVRMVASIDIKEDEEGLVKFAAENKIRTVFYSSSELNMLPDIGYSKSDFVKGTTGVDCVCERAAMAASHGGELIIKKTSDGGVTVAVVKEPFSADFGDE
ncbi:MAG: cobalamin biosynthesis protein [Methanomassiliicoccaceae archaeon]|nr:cobalamin biosynthesis protein [Methanomassiliicoccaceae archaeon]